MHFDIESLWLTEKPWADIRGHAMRAVFFVQFIIYWFSHKDSISKWRLWIPLEKIVVLRRVIMAELQDAKISRMRLNTRCLRSVVVCPGNHRSSSQ